MGELSYSQTMAKISEKLKKYNLPSLDIVDAHKIDFEEGNLCLKTAQTRLNDFNGLQDSEVQLKNACLANGVYSAVLAAECFETIIESYKKNLDFQLDFDPAQDKVLKDEILCVYGNRQAWLNAIASLTESYNRKQYKHRSDYEDGDKWEQISIQDAMGIKPYHLHRLIKYCDKMKANIAKVTFANDPNTDLINEYVEKGNNYLTAINMCLSRDFPENMDDWTHAMERKVSDLCCKMIACYLNAFMLICDKSFTPFDLDKIYNYDIDKTLTRLETEAFLKNEKLKFIYRSLENLDLNGLVIAATRYENDDDVKISPRSRFVRDELDHVIKIATDLRFELDKNTANNLPNVGY